MVHKLQSGPRQGRDPSEHVAITIVVHTPPPHTSSASGVDTDTRGINSSSALRQATAATTTMNDRYNGDKATDSLHPSSVELPGSTLAGASGIHRNAEIGEAD